MSKKELSPTTTEETTTTPKSKSKLALILAAMGPGFVAAMAGNDAGGISTHSVAGANYGYGTLWIIVVMTFILIIAQETSGRMGAVTGKGFGSLIREKFGIRLSAIAMGALFIANCATMISEFAGVAAGMELFGVSKYVAVPLAAALVWFLLMGGSYKRTEKIFLAISCVFITYIIAAFLSGPDWLEVGKATVVPKFETSTGFLALTIEMIGTTVAPWMLFFTQSNVVEKGVGVKDLFSQKADAITGSIAAGFVAWFTIITTGTVLFPEGIAVSDAASAASALAPVAGVYAEKLFGIGLVAASLLAACVMPLTSSYSICEAFGWERGLERPWAEAKIFKSLITFIIIFGAAAVLLPNINLIQVMLTAQLINGILLPLLLVFMILIVNDKRLIGKHKNSKAYNFVTWITVGVVIILTVTLLIFQLLGLA
jgi:Mn2+/Fe2+ NRAMP family transporter